MQDSDIIFGGEKKLKKAIQEAYDLFHPKSIAVFATCPVGLIGDDIHTVTKNMKEELGDRITSYNVCYTKLLRRSPGSRSCR